MKGNIEYLNKINNRIENLLKENNEQYYVGFYHFITNNVSPSTAYNYLNYIIDFIKSSDKDVREIELDDYTAFLSGIVTKSSSYQIAVYSALKQFSLYLKASKKNERNSMQYIRRPKAKESIVTKTKRANGYLNKAEIQQYIDAVECGVGSARAIKRQERWRERDVAIVMMFLNTGMRCSALYKLDVEDIDLVHMKLTTVDKGTKINYYEISDDLADILRDWLNKRENILHGKADESALFISNMRTRMTQSAISDVVKKYAKNIKGKKITPHKLRATYGTQLYEATKDIVLVRDAMKHSNTRVTELYIRNGVNNNEKVASNIMSNIIFNNK